MERSVAICGVEVREWDYVRLTGLCLSWTGGPRRLESVSGTVGTVQTEWQELKLWPDDGLDDGKLWFRFDDIEKLEILERDED